MEWNTYGNIDSLLLARHTAKKIRNAAARLKGPSRRKASQDEAFVLALEQLLNYLEDELVARE